MFFFNFLNNQFKGITCFSLRRLLLRYALVDHVLCFRNSFTSLDIISRNSLRCGPPIVSLKLDEYGSGVGAALRALVDVTGSILSIMPVLKLVLIMLM